LIFGEDRQSDHFVVTNLQDKKIDKSIFLKKKIGQVLIKM